MNDGVKSLLPRYEIYSFEWNASPHDNATYKIYYQRVFFY